MTQLGERTAEGSDRASANVLEFPDTASRAHRRHRRLWWITGAAATLLVAVLGAVLYFSPVLAVTTVTVTGTDLLQRDRAQELLSPVQGRPLPQVGQQTVEDLLGDEPAVDDVRVRAEPPHGLSVEVVEHVPVAMVHRGQDRILYSAAGTVLATLPSDRAAEYQLPSVKSAEDVRDPRVFDAITSVLGTLPESIRGQLRSASAETTDSVTLTLTDGRTVLWGNPEQGARKAQVLEVLLTMPEDEGEGMSVREFDVSTPDRPVTR